MTTTLLYIQVENNNIICSTTYSLLKFGNCLICSYVINVMLLPLRSLQCYKIIVLVNYCNCSVIHTYIHTYVHACHTYIHAYMHTYICTYVHTYIHTCIHACMHTYIHTYIRTYIHMYLYVYK